MARKEKHTMIALDEESHEFLQEVADGIPRTSKTKALKAVLRATKDKTNSVLLKETTKPDGSVERLYGINWNESGNLRDLLDEVNRIDASEK